VRSPVAAPALIKVNHPLARELGLDPATLESAEGVAVLAGNAVAEGSTPIAQVYAGHQFGGFSPQLGDGRAILLGELERADGRLVDVQLKGSGRTPYSRMGDGRAWMGPVIREYIVSEAMHALGVPTTRALAAVSTGEIVLREAPMPGAVLTRVAASHIRVGTFQYFAARQDTEALEVLTDYAIRRHYPDAEGAMGLLKAVIAAQAELIAKWMGLGFIHGVMNTDNMTISGETIDYGPCAFMETYHPETVYSSIDHYGRYAYANQPQIAVWNLAQLATALLPLMGEDRDAAIAEATEVVHGFADLYAAAWKRVFAAKLGLDPADERVPGIAEGFLKVITGTADFTLAFRGLASGETRALFEDPSGFDAWAADWAGARVAGWEETMRAANPAYIPRNHRVEEAIQAAVQGDFAPFERMVSVLGTPFEEQAGAEDLLFPARPEEAVTRTFCGT